jgi:hypothetical protein
MKQLIFIILLIFALNLYGQIPTDSIKINNWTIEFFDLDSIKLTDYFEDQSAIDSISKNHSNWHQKSLAIEKYQIAKYRPNISIDNDSRIVELTSGTKINLTPNDTTEEAGYTFEKEFIKNGFLFFRVQWFEGNNYFLLDLKTGQKYYTIGRVFFSKNGNYIMSINDDIDAGYSKNGFQLFSIDKDNSLNEIWYYDTDFAPTLIEWIDDKNLLVKGYTLDENSDWNPKTIYKKMKITKR